MQQACKKLLVILFGLLVLASPLYGSASNKNQDVRSYNIGRGRVVFAENCVKCHREGNEGAPVLDEVTDWQPRIQQPLSALIEHAIKGHGKMPPKGGLEGLSDQDVAAAVAYVVYNGRLLVAAQSDETENTDDALEPKTECHRKDLGEKCTAKDASDSVLMQMFWLLTNRER